MRAIYIILMLLMLVFAAVQYNDPDGLMWMVIYAVPAVWAAIAAFKRTWLANNVAHWCLLVCIFLSIVGVVYYWPESQGWWRQEIWWEVETAREGMGMMIIAIVLSVVWQGRRSQLR